MNVRTLIITGMLLFLTACGKQGGQSLDGFKEQWYAAVNQRKPELLYPLLDAKSRRAIDQALETLRGLSEQDQLAVINHLGGDRVRNLHELSNDRYFGLWWDKTTEGQLPTMTIEAQGDQSAYMIVALGERKQRFELKVEGGRWVWSLGEQKLDVTPEKKKE